MANASAPRRRALLGGDILDHGQRRRLGGQARQERVHRRARALHLGDDAAGVVEDEAGEAELPGQPVDVGAKAHALDGAVHAHPRPAAVPDGRAQAHPTSSRSAWYALAWASWMRGMCSERVTTTWSASSSAAIRPPS